MISGRWARWPAARTEPLSRAAPATAAPATALAAVVRNVLRETPGVAGSTASVVVESVDVDICSTPCLLHVGLVDRMRTWRASLFDSDAACAVVRGQSGINLSRVRSSGAG